MAQMSLGLGEIKLAVECAERLREQEKRTLATALQRAGIYAESGYLHRALATAEPLTIQEPKNPSPMHLCGTVRAQLGDFEKADSYLRKVVTLSPQLGISWLTLSSFTDFARDNVLFEKLSESRSYYSENEALNWMHYHYALGKAFTDKGNYEKAVDSYKKGAVVMAERSKYRKNFDNKFVTQLQTYFNKEAIQTLPKSRSCYSRPIAVLGLPRSGTTLLGQMLTNHSAVEGAGETGAFGQACRHLSPQDTMNFPSFMGRHGDPQASMDMITQTYQHLTDLRFPKGNYVVDKSLNLNRLFGIWAKAVPEGKAIYIKRKKEHVAWSCYKTAFRSGADWSWSMDTIENYITNETRLLQHWQQCFPDRVLTITYEDLVLNPEEVMTTVFEHLGLDFEKAALSPVGSHNPVLTSSLGQVNEPITDNNIKRVEELLLINSKLKV